MKIHCSQCAAVIDVSPTDRFLTCAYCDSPLLLVRGRTFQPLMVRPLIEGRRARQLAEEAALGPVPSSGELVFIPYWIRDGMLELACPSWEITHGIPALRPKPAGEIRYQQDESDQERAGEHFLDPDGGEEQEGRTTLFYIPYYFFDPPEGGVSEAAPVIDALDGKALGLPAREWVSVRTLEDILWCGGMLVLPLVAALAGGSWFLVLLGGAVPAGGFLLRGRSR